MTDYKKTVLFTGASRGIGRACAVELARTGHTLVLNSRRPSAEMDETVRLCEEAGAEVRTLFFDVGSTEAAREARDRLALTDAELLGKLDQALDCSAYC